MTRVLKGEGFGIAEIVIPLFVCVVLTLGGLWFVARMLRHAALK
jgi:hypothetical protein